jgi:hypothetical protein
MANPKIVYPAAPPLPQAPVLSQVTGGSLGARTYYVFLTFQAADGEGLQGPEASLAISANKLLKVASPSFVDGATPPIGYNVYAGTTPGAGTKQNAAAIALGTDWTEPVTGLISGGLPPTSWGTSFTFVYPPRNLPAFDRQGIVEESLSTGGVRQIVWLRTDSFQDIDMPFIVKGADADAWTLFLAYAVRGTPFDYYPDASQSAHDSYALVGDMDTVRLEYRSPGLYQLKLRARKIIV